MKRCSCGKVIFKSIQSARNNARKLNAKKHGIRVKMYVYRCPAAVGIIYHITRRRGRKT